MKYNKVISFTLLNAFALMMFATLLASCQKSSVTQKGHFTAYYSDRSPASADQAILYDSKQIYLYCKLNALETQKCFKKTLTKILMDKVRDEEISKDQMNLVLDKVSYKSVESEVVNIAENISVKMEDDIATYSSKRQTFCSANAKKDMKRCLHRHLHADSLKILNSYQKINNDLNGQEYLFLKDHLRKHFEAKYDQFVETKNI